jgi:hypothetical protein
MVKAAESPKADDREDAGSVVLVVVEDEMARDGIACKRLAKLLDNPPCGRGRGE